MPARDIDLDADRWSHDGSNMRMPFVVPGLRYCGAKMAYQVLMYYIIIHLISLELIVTATSTIVTPCIGGGGVTWPLSSFFAKIHANDIDDNLINMYRHIKEKKDAFLAELSRTINRLSSFKKFFLYIKTNSQLVQEFDFNDTSPTAENSRLQFAVFSWLKVWGCYGPFYKDTAEKTLYKRHINKGFRRFKETIDELSEMLIDKNVVLASRDFMDFLGPWNEKETLRNNLFVYDMPYPGNKGKYVNHTTGCATNDKGYYIRHWTLKNTADMLADVVAKASKGGLVVMFSYTSEQLLLELEAASTDEDIPWKVLFVNRKISGMSEMIVVNFPLPKNIGQ
jgi:site-specific DNA-adenine methylase